MDFAIATAKHLRPIELRAVPLFVLPGPKGDILLGKAQQEELGLTPTSQLMAQAAANLRGAVIARDPLDTNGRLVAAAGEPVQKLMRLTLVGDGENVEESAAGDASDDEADLPEEGLREGDLRRDNSAEMTREIEMMLEQATQNGLPRRFQDDLRALIDDFVDVFRLELGLDPPAKVRPLEIELIDASLPERRGGRPRSFAPLQRQFLDEHIKLLLKIGVIEKCNGNEAAPIVLVRKKNGEWRMCIDLRKINSNTRAYRWPLPKIKEMLPYLGKAKCFASFDLLRGFWQFPVQRESRKRWAFLTHSGQYCFNRVVMGGKNSASYFQQTMQEVLGDLVYVSVLIYIDDVLVYAENFKELLVAMQSVFLRLRQYGIFLKPRKCTLFAQSIVWCGHRISKEGYGINSEYLQAVQDIPAPLNAATLRQFLASCNWVRDSIPNYALIVSPIQELLKKVLADCSRKTTRVACKKSLGEHWTAVEAGAFENIKAAVARAVTLAHLRDDSMVCLFTDASMTFWGAMLTQVSVEDYESNASPLLWHHEPLGFLSGRFRGAQERWVIPDKKGFAIRIACENLRIY